MRCGFSFDPKELVRSIPYKYLVSNPKFRHEQFEFLGTAYRPEYSRSYSFAINRALNISENKLLQASNKGIYHQYDTMAVPEDISSLMSKWWYLLKSSVRSFLGMQHKLNLQPYSQDMEKMCLQFYLELNQYEETLTAVAFDDDLTMEEYIEQIHHIFTCVSEPSTTSYNVPTGNENVYTWNEHLEQIRKCFAAWLKQLVQTVRLQDLSTAKQLQLGVCILWCISKFELPTAEVKSMSDFLLRLVSNAQKYTVSQVEGREWVEYTQLCSFLQNKEHRDMVVEAVKRISHAHIAERLYSSFIVDWIYWIPLYSFLTGTFKPYDNIDIQPVRKLADNWSMIKSHFKLKNTGRRVEKFQYFNKVYFNPLRTLFDCDPLALQVSIYFCPYGNLPGLFELISPNVSIAWLLFMLTDLSHPLLTKKDVLEWNAWMCLIKSKITKDASQSPSAFLEHVMLLFIQLTKDVRSSSEHCAMVIKEAASLVCITLEGSEENEKISVLKSISSHIKEWINSPCIIGENMFGYDDTIYNSPQFVKGLPEMTIWKSFLSLKCGEWQQIICDIFLARVKRVSDCVIVPLLQFVEKNGNEFLTGMITDESLIEKAANSFLLINSTDEQLASVDEITARGDSRVFGHVLSFILEKHYHDELKNETYEWITLDTLLDWVAWPNYIKIFQQGSECLLRKDLSLKCQETCCKALSRFQSVCYQVQRGELTMLTLHKLDTNKKIVSRLCKAAALECASEWLEQRVCESQLFLKRRGTYREICNRISDPSKVKGLTFLKKDLERNIDNEKILSLWRKMDGAIKICCYETAEPLSQFAVKYEIMMEKSSNLFLHFLNDKVKETLQLSSDLVISDIFTKIWVPVLEECEELIKSLINRTILLTYVDTHLKLYSKHLRDVVLSLECGVSKCFGETFDQELLESSLDIISKYWQLGEYQTGALVFLELKNVLELKGDFTLVESFKTKLSHSMVDQSLAIIDENLIETGGFLKEICDDPQRVRCLQAFTKSQDIVIWLRETTSGVNDIQGFVTVSLDTAAGGEGDLVHDKLSNLCTVGNSFATLIYEVEKDDGYKELMEKCKSLWEALKQKSKLPELLESCNNDLEWYKSVKETQGSVETTSTGQMMNILKYGTYTVSFREEYQSTVCSVHSLVDVTLTQEYQKLAKTKYTLDELRDLESKLVLICGNKAETKAEVDHYLNLLQCATRIANLYLDLQKAGEITYSSEYLRFRCVLYDREELEAKVVHPHFCEENAKEFVSDLHEYIRRLDARLIDWNKTVDDTRERYYELNYFTTLQLLDLQKEFDRLSPPTNTASPVKPSILMLLKSISPGISSSVVSDSLNHVKEVTPAAENSSGMANIPEEVGSSTLQKAATTSPGNSSTTNLVLRKLKESLNEKQEPIFTHCTEFLSFPESHALKALQACGPEATIYEVQEWCDSNEVVEEEIDNCTENDISDNEKSDSEETDTANVSSAVKTAGNTVLSASETSRSLTIMFRPTVDETHPFVQELKQAGYNLQDAIKAVDRFRDLQKASEFLDKQAREEPVDGSHIQSAEVSAANVISMEDCEIEEVIIYERREAEASKNHLKLKQLGGILQDINERVEGAVTVRRTFSSGLFKAGLPNLLITSPDNILRSALALYCTDTDLPLPSQEEVFLCTSKTTAEEVGLLWRRAVGDPGFKRIFCLAHAEKLSYQVCDAALRSLGELTQGKNDYRLVIICSSEDKEKSHIISRLQLYKRPVVPLLIENECKDYLRAHFKPDVEATSSPFQAGACASMVDPDNLCVRVVSSSRSGMGKSLYIKRRTDELLKQTSNSHVTIPVHGPVVNSDILLDFLSKHTERNACTLYHLDIAPTVLKEVDYLLFSLLILNGLSDSRGHMWRCHPSQMYMVEVTVPEEKADHKNFQTLQFLSLLPTIHCVSPRVVLEQEKLGEEMLGMDEMEFRSSAVQRVYQYLRRHIERSINLDDFSFDTNFEEPEGRVTNFIKVILSQCSIQDPSWAEVHFFTKFLDLQLFTCESWIFCDKSVMGDAMSGLKSFVIKFMIRMSQDFSTPSLEGVVTRESREKRMRVYDHLDQYQIVERRQWEKSSHPYIFFNDDQQTITFVGFMVTENGDLIEPHQHTVIERAIMKPQLYKELKRNKVNFAENCHEWNKIEMIQKLAIVMGFKYLNSTYKADDTSLKNSNDTTDHGRVNILVHKPDDTCAHSSSITCVYDPDGTYVLTIDNLIKILAIQMRFRCNVPVVIMGETGCGKTRLIRYMCDLARQKRHLRNMLILKIHGGITDQDVIKFVEDAEKEAQKNRAIDKKLDTVVFFDEANTTESIGLIKEIMCDRRINGRTVSKDLKFIAACNPYRKHTQEMISKLENAGLGFYVRETQQRLGKIPLRQLVYRVLDIPPSMRPLVYDFGQLNTDVEYDYTHQIVCNHIYHHQTLLAVCKERTSLTKAVSVVLAKSQKFMRDQKNECSFVSLRDVERAMIVFEYFYDKMAVFAPLINKRATKEYKELCGSDKEPTTPFANDITRSLILSLSVCYDARLQKREPYEELISQYFSPPLHLPAGTQQFQDEIRWCQEVVLDNMVVGDNIARNAALRENVFMMAICIELRIPLFLVGKPGSSKSLAKSIIQDSMYGTSSKSELLRTFKQVHMFSYQCSQLSTPESIIDVFKSAKKFQSSQDIQQYVSVVVLDEVGLAEDSPSLPLKALHPLLEDGTEGTGKDYQHQVVAREERVAFIGISNWALDPAKMNRGVMVTRGEPGKEELIFSAKGICSTKDNDPVREQLEHHFEPLSQAYMTICAEQTRQFFGLRDFYSLIKMLYWMCKKSNNHPLSWAQMEHAIRRNFSGLEDESLNPFEEFQKEIGWFEREVISSEDPELNAILNPDCSRLGLIKKSLYTKEKTWHGENRYLLFLTENYAALNILKHYINIGFDSKDSSNQPYILFGSSFPKDKDYTHVCRNINEIKICMETGKIVILLNLENLYESLYDVLNQYYLDYCDGRYVDLGLQSHRVKCRVDPNFKLILIGEKETVYKKFSTPLINRLEKHFVLASSVLEDWQRALLESFEQWIRKFSRARDTSGNQFEEAHAFIGYQKDTPAAVIFQATNQLRRIVLKQEQKDSCHKKTRVLNENLLNKLSESPDGSSEWAEAVQTLSQFLLLQTAADDAIVRLQNTSFSKTEVERVLTIYYEYQHHNSLEEFLKNECEDDQEMFMQVSTHSPLMSEEELKEMAKTLSLNVFSFNLHGFDTEVDFTNKISPVFNREEKEAKTSLLIVQCDSGHLNYDLIACARYRVCYEATKAKTKAKAKAKSKDQICGTNNITHILFIIRLPQQEVKSQFVGFQGEPWISVHIDELRIWTKSTVLPQQAFTAKISELFIGRYDEKKPGRQLYKDPERISKESEENTNVSKELEEIKEDIIVSEEPEEMEINTGEAKKEEVLDLENVAIQLKEPTILQSVRGDYIEITLEPSEPEQKRVLPEALNFAALELSKESAETELEKEPKEITSNDRLDVTNKWTSSESEKPQEDHSESEDSSSSSDDDDDKSSLSSVAGTTVAMKKSNIDDSVLQLQEGSLLSNEARDTSIHGMDENRNDEHFLINELNIEVEGTKQLHANHQRLLGCVQAAVSMLYNSTGDRSMKRIQKLVELIQLDELDQLVCQDGASFYDLLVKFIHIALRRGEERAKTYGKDWVLMEAMSGRKLQNGGTFRNVLARRIDEVITPQFAKVIAHIDQYCNLDLLDAEKLDISKFWLDMFNLSGGKIDFSSESTGKIMINTDFSCQLPFSWIIKDTIDTLAQSTLSSSNGQYIIVQNKCVKDLSQTKLGKFLSLVAKDKSDVDKFYEKYLHDFVRIVYQCSYRGDLGEIECKLIMNALDAMTKSLCSVISLPQKIVALHLVYSQCSLEMLQFGQLVQHRPGILKPLSKKDHPDLDFSLHFHAVQQILESDQSEADPTQRTIIGLSPPIYNKQQSDVTINVHHWLNHVRLSQNVIDSILKTNIRTKAAIKARSTWQMVRALQIFAETVYVKLSEIEGMHFLFRRILIPLKKNSDFLKEESIAGVRRVLDNMFKMKELKGLNEDQKIVIRQHCSRFFMEMVSSLCFGGREVPEPALIQLMLDKVLHDSRSSPLLQEGDDKPVVRSTLLQLLLQHGFDQVKEYLDEYFCQCCKAVGDHDSSDYELCLLCVQCFEDTLHKEVSLLSGDQQTHKVTKIFADSLQFLQKYLQSDEPVVTLQYLQTVARVKFVLSLFAEQFISSEGHVDDRLFEVTHTLCTDSIINKAYTVGPAIYLLKLIARKFGLHYLKQVSQDYAWIVPRPLDRHEEEKDLFLIYGKSYLPVRNIVKSVMDMKKTEQLKDYVDQQGGCEPIFLTLALYHNVTLSRAIPAKQPQAEVLHSLNTFIRECSVFSDDIILMMRLLVANEQAVPLAQMTVSPQQPAFCRTLGGIVVHTVSVIMNKVSVDLLLPFVNMLNNPAVLKNAYLPTMPQDMPMKRRRTGTTFYECPNHHSYFVEKATMEEICRECGAKLDYQQANSSSQAKMDDATKTGYDLGAPKRRSSNPERVRDLSAPAVCIVRALMHSVFVWATCNNQQELEHIAEVTKRKVVPANLPEFFWIHLEKDMECMMQCTGRGIEECAIIVHLVLQQIFFKTPETSTDMSSLKSKDDCREWERSFNQYFVKPVLTNLDTIIPATINMLCSDDQQEHNDSLFHLVYEKVKVDENKLEAHLWTFRPQINLEHLKRIVQADGSRKILDAFLQVEPSLRATQYLPDIVKLQHFLVNFYDKRLRKDEAEKLTIGNFFEAVEKKFNVNSKNEWRTRFESLRKAWALVGHKLKNHTNNHLVVEEQYLLLEFTLDTPLVYLLPSTMKKGRCTNALIEYLVLTHNDLIETCRTHDLEFKGAESASVVWREHKISIKHIHRCHVLDYELQIQSIILSHCHYSLRVGEGQKIKYHLQALERHILSRFIYGKPIIQLVIPNVAYQKDVYTAETFIEIRRKVRPQEPLDQRVQQDILAELKTPDKLRESLDVVEIVMGLLSSEGGNPKFMLKRYISSCKMRKKSFSAKAKEHCTLGHIISLWETLSVELARLHWQKEEEPFEAIPDCYREKLADDQQKELDKCLRMFDLDLLLGALFEFMEIHVKLITTDESASRLVDGLVNYWRTTGQHSIDFDRFKKDFPSSITVGQVVAAWKHIADYKVKVVLD